MKDTVIGGEEVKIKDAISDITNGWSPFDTTPMRWNWSSPSFLYKTGPPLSPSKTPLGLTCPSLHGPMSMVRSEASRLSKFRDSSRLCPANFVFMLSHIT